MARRDALREDVCEWLDTYKAQAGLPTWGKVAAEAGIPASTMTAIRKSGRMSVKVAKQLAEALRPTNRNLREFTTELFRIAKLDPERLGAESVADRVRRTRTIRAGYIISEPFVLTPDKEQREPTGFAIELFEAIAAQLGVSVDYAPVPVELGGMSSALASGEYDVIVSAVLRTFGREALMAFSAPFPFLRVPLSAIHRRTATLERLTVRMLVDWAAMSRADATLKDLRFLLVDGEVGDEFVRTFLSRTGQRPNIHRVKTLEPSVLLGELQNRDVLIADMATCAAVIALDPASVQAVPDVEPYKSININTAIVSPDGYRGLPFLALYPICFALPLQQPEWKLMVDAAMQSLLLEGLKPLAYLYQRYRDSPHHLRRFAHADDEEVRSELVRTFFRSLFEPHETYRSRDLPRGFFSEVGNLHVHVDGGGDVAVVERLLRRLESHGFKGKVTQIIDNVSGPQRALLPDTYASHTPGSGAIEQFDYFSTVSAGSRGQAIELLRHLLPEVLRRPDLVVEVERVVGRVDETGRLNRADVPPLEPISEADVDVTPSPTLAYEIHHAFDTHEGVPVPGLEELARDTEAAGISTGGWFRFAKGDVIAYRSNAFSDGTNLTAVVEKEHAALQRYLSTRGLDVRVRTVVEQVLGIWHSAPAK